MNSAEEETFAYCGEFIRRRDEDRWLAAHYAPPAERRRLYALYALHLEIERIPALVSEPQLGEIRLQWWREAIEELGRSGAPRAHPAIEAARAGEILDAPAREAFGTAIDARARLLYGEPFTSCDELADFLLRADAFLAALAARRLAPISDDQERALERAGLANALARRGPVLAPALRNEIRDRVEKLHREAAPLLRTLSPRAMPAAAHFALTRGYLFSGRGPSPLAKRVRIFAAVASGRV